MEIWKEEMQYGEDKRLAFLRAYYRIKPRACVLPRSWTELTREAVASGAKPVPKEEPEQRVAQQPRNVVYWQMRRRRPVTE